ncbi:outer dense fiber protein 3-like protein 2a isoform X1 [Cyprinodon tularosa]|uniref:outer dense fiber protein 3-like protein 2a isoform X1 n=1 Tax=Cyprinodon tularosa TaxID=77115 RepID=UPI0018E20D03|nr:outer dense fiber protein 3-like protein 2a isoform X1 [Cyprinodon tularosa]
MSERAAEGRRKSNTQERGWRIMEEVVRKRPIISAKERGPGPGRYALPPTVGYINHDFTKPNSPAYSFHGRMSSAMISIDSSPGPRYYIGGNITRFGRTETPSYSISGRGRRIRKKDELFQTPGPGAYSPERAPPLNGHRRPPSYTIGERTRYRTVDPVPAPNSYTLPDLLGPQNPHKPASASYSFSGRRTIGGPSEDLSKTPGPGQYRSIDPDIYRQRQPCFSMQSRTKRQSSSSVAPGPGTYSPEKTYRHLHKSPSFTMGIRHSEFVTPLVVNVKD